MTDSQVGFKGADGHACRDGRPLARLAEVIVGHRARTTRARDRSDTMISLVQRIGNAGVPANLTVHHLEDVVEPRDRLARLAKPQLPQLCPLQFAHEPVPRAIRTVSASCNTTGTPSRLSWTSNSKGTFSDTACARAAREFSGRAPPSSCRPRWAMGAAVSQSAAVTIVPPLAERERIARQSRPKPAAARTRRGPDPPSCCPARDTLGAGSGVADDDVPAHHRGRPRVHAAPGTGSAAARRGLRRLAFALARCVTRSSAGGGGRGVAVPSGLPGERTMVRRCPAH